MSLCFDNVCFVNVMVVLDVFDFIYVLDGWCVLLFVLVDLDIKLLCLDGCFG